MRKLGSLLVVLSLGLFLVGCGDTSSTPATTPAATGDSGTADEGAAGTEKPATPAAGSETKTE
jgi:hypothetical protein